MKQWKGVYICPNTVNFFFPGKLWTLKYSGQTIEFREENALIAYDFKVESYSGLLSCYWLETEKIVLHLERASP